MRKLLDYFLDWLCARLGLCLCFDGDLFHPRPRVLSVAVCPSCGLPTFHPRPRVLSGLRVSPAQEM